MVAIYGRSSSSVDSARRTGDLAGFAGVRPVTLGDGVERGVRVMEFRTGTGIAFDVPVDRAMDIGACEHESQGGRLALAHRIPPPRPARGRGGGRARLLRCFPGLPVTCGLDHVGFPVDEPPQCRHAPRSTVRHALHGRIGTAPACLGGCGERWDGDRCAL